jgi:hypothetical protein
MASSEYLEDVKSRPENKRGNGQMSGSVGQFIQFWIQSKWAIVPAAASSKATPSQDGVEVSGQASGDSGQLESIESKGSTAKPKDSHVSTETVQSENAERKNKKAKIEVRELAEQVEYRRAASQEEELWPQILVDFEQYMVAYASNERTAKSYTQHVRRLHTLEGFSAHTMSHEAYLEDVRQRPENKRGGNSMSAAIKHFIEFFYSSKWADDPVVAQGRPAAIQPAADAPPAVSGDSQPKTPDGDEKAAQPDVAARKRRKLWASEVLETKEEEPATSEASPKKEELVKLEVSQDAEPSGALQDVEEPSHSKPKIAERTVWDKYAIVEESLADYPPERSGLDADVLERLPSEAPLDSKAWTSTKVVQDKLLTLRVTLYSPSQKNSMQVTKLSALDNLYAAFRIARACWMKLEEGIPKQEVVQFRNDCVRRLKSGSVGDGAGDEDKAVGKDIGQTASAPSSDKASASSSASSSESEPEPLPRVGRAVAKMSVRSGLRCFQNYKKVL